VKKRVSIHDIATHLKVSASTVSFVLNGKAEEMRISDAVAERIKKYAEEVSYRPNLIAKSLRTGKSKIIGMMVEDISDPFFASIARGIERIAYQQGYKIFFASTENKTSKAKDLVKVFRERQVDAYIIAPPPEFSGEIRSLLDDGKPLVLFDRYYPELTTNNIIVDNYEGTFKAISYLQNEGYKNIGFITLDSDQWQMAERLRGYKEAVMQHGRSKYVLQVPYLMNEREIIEKMKAFLSEYTMLDAVLFGTNYLTLNGFDAIRELKKSIPQDIAVISFDDSPVFHLLSPAVTAIAQPIRKISETVVNKIMWYLDNESTACDFETIVLPTELILRDSVMRRHSTDL
jgi:LacI family transcriptional regulator